MGSKLDFAKAAVTILSVGELEKLILSDACPRITAKRQKNCLSKKSCEFLRLKTTQPNKRLKKICGFLMYFKGNGLEGTAPLLISSIREDVDFISSLPQDKKKLLIRSIIGNLKLER